MNLAIRKKLVYFQHETVSIYNALIGIFISLRKINIMHKPLPGLKNYINDSFTDVASNPDKSICNANSGELLQQHVQSTPEQVEEALATVERQFESSEWETTPAFERADKLDQIAEALNNDTFFKQSSEADSLTTGIIINTTAKLAMFAGHTFSMAASYLRSGVFDSRCDGPCGEVEYLRRSWGPALLITPWNSPTILAAHKIASALAAGSCCILKPSEWAPHSAYLLSKAISSVDLPAGTFQLVLGDHRVGSSLTNDPRIASVSFTGGLSGGQAIARDSADLIRPLQLELGGNNPVIVFKDADLDAAALGVVYGLTNLNAQWCRALGRLLVDQAVKVELLDKVMSLLKSIKLGSSMDSDSQMGPVVHANHHQLILKEIAQLKASGGEVLQATNMPELEGYFIPPTLIDGLTPDQTTDEIFGPVGVIHTFENTEEALALANGTAFGLGAVVFSQNEDFAFEFSRKIRTGGVKINGYSLMSQGEGAPRSAWGLSGLGEEGLSQSIEFFAGARIIGVSPQDPLGGA